MASAYCCLFMIWLRRLKYCEISFHTHLHWENKNISAVQSLCLSLPSNLPNFELHPNYFHKKEAYFALIQPVDKLTQTVG